MNKEQRAAVQRAVRNLVSAITSSALYAPEHPQVSRLRGAALAELTVALDASNEISLLVIDDELLYDSVPLDSGLHTARFVTLLKSRGIGHLKFLRGVTPREIDSLAESFSSPTVGDFHSSRHIRAGRVEVRFSADGSEQSTTALPSLSDFSADDIAHFHALYTTVGSGGKLQLTGISEMVSGFISALQVQAFPLMALAPLRDLDEYTFTHATNVCLLNLAQAMSLGIGGTQLQEIGIAGLLHDIGKLFIPREVLVKPEGLTDGEWELMRQHPTRGARCLIETPGVPRLAAIVAFEHHMKHDFSGYPAVPTGWRQSLCSEMTAISDFFDAMRTHRTYRNAVELNQIAGILLENHGKEFHPLLTRNFLLLLTKLMDQ